MLNGIRVSAVTIRILVFVFVFSLLFIQAGTAATDENLIASTFLGGSNTDGVLEVPLVIDNDGNIFVASRTQSTINFPITDGAYDSVFHGGDDEVFISKFNSDLTTLLASTYIGGVSNDGSWPGVSLALGDNGEIYVAGRTFSSDFPVTPGISYQSTKSGSSDAFIAKFDNDLTTLLASTYFGGVGNEYYVIITPDDNGNIYLIGTTTSYNIPGMSDSSMQQTYIGGGGGTYPGDIFISKLDGDLSNLLMSTYLSGSSNDYCEAVVRDNSGNLYLTGWTASGNFPFTPDADDTLHDGGIYDGFVTKLDANLTTLMGSTFFGGTQWDFGYGLMLDESGNVYVTGHTASPNYVTTTGAFDELYNYGGDDVFITKYSADLTTMLASTFLGGTGWECGFALSQDDQGKIYVAGHTNASNFPRMTGVYDESYNGGTGNNGDVFISRMTADLSDLISSTYIGGSANENLASLAFDQNGDIVISGITNSTDYPTNPYSYDTLYNGGGPTEWGEDRGGDIFISIMPKAYFYDFDNDEVVDPADNCLETANPDQEDTDLDNVGDSCDNCIEIYNPGQVDSDENGVGDACQFKCGDIDNNGAVNILDVTFLISYLYKGGAIPQSMWASDPDGNVTVNILDITYLIGYLYKGGSEPVCQVL